MKFCPKNSGQSVFRLEQAIVHKNVISWIYSTIFYMTLFFDMILFFWSHLNPLFVQDRLKKK